MKCPQCQSKAELRGRRHTCPVSTVYLMIGGIILPFLFSFSRKRKYHCPKCDSSFFKLPLRSALVRPLFWLCIVFPIFVVIALLAIATFMAIFAR